MNKELEGFQKVSYFLAALAHGATNATGASFWREAARAFVPP